MKYLYLKKYKREIKLFTRKTENVRMLCNLSLNLLLVIVFSATKISEFVAVNSFPAKIYNRTNFVTIVGKFL